MFSNKQKEQMIQYQEAITKECKNCKQSFDDKNLLPPCEHKAACPNPIVSANIKYIVGI